MNNKNKEQYQRSFNTLHLSDDFREKIKDIPEEYGKDKIMKQTLKSSLAIIALAVLSTAAQAQTYADYNKRELLWQVLDQSRANDYVPVFFNIHFPAKEGQKAVQSHIDWYKTTHVDFVNVKYEYFPEIQAVSSTKDWKNIKPFAPETWE